MRGSRAPAALAFSSPPSIFILPIKPQQQPQQQQPPPPPPPCLNASLWSFLPEDVLERILASLPPLSFLRFRCVCKRWSLLLSDSPRFLLLRRHLSPSLPPAFVATISPPPPPSISIDHPHPWSQIPIHPTPFRNFSCRSSHGGLLCCSWGSHSQYFVVCNPATKTWRDLPPLPLENHLRFVPHFVALVVENSSSTYKVLVSGEAYQRRAIHQSDFDHWMLVFGADASYNDDHHWRPLNANGPDRLNTFVYESATGSWKDTGLFQGRFPMPYFTHHSSATLWNGTLIWTSSSHAMDHTYLIMCRVADDSWSCLETRNSLSCGVLSQLMEHNGDLLIMGIDQAACTIITWKLEPTQMLWTEIDRCPIPEEQSYIPGVHTLGVQCVKGHELIHITVYLDDFRRVGVYHLTGKVWQWLPASFSTRSIFPGDRHLTTESYFPVEPQQGFRGVHFPFEVKLEALP